MKEGKTLNDILRTHIFSIPNYQRGYAWQNRQSDDLWDDINRQWEAISLYLGKDEHLNENRLIADHLSVYRQAKYTVFSESEAEDKIFETFSKHSEKVLLGANCRNARNSLQ